MSETQGPGRPVLPGPTHDGSAVQAPLSGGPLGQSRALAEPGSPDGEVARRGMFSGSGDTSGFGGLVVQRPTVVSTPRPLGGWFDEVVDALQAHFGAETFPLVLVDRGELTLHVQRERIADVCRLLRDDPSLRFELLSNLSGVDYLGEAQRLHVVYNLTSMTWRRRLRLEVSCTVEDPHVPTVTWVYPTADWQERETFDFFGVAFDGHPGLTRIQMPDDWAGHPQRKDYPLGGVPVEYKGAQIPPPDERRAYA